MIHQYHGQFRVVVIFRDAQVQMRHTVDLELQQGDKQQSKFHHFSRIIFEKLL